MKPHRIRMTHNLLLNYGLYRKMEIYVSIELVMEKNISEGSYFTCEGFNFDATDSFLLLISQRGKENANSCADVFLFSSGCLW